MRKKIFSDEEIFPYLIFLVFFSKFFFVEIKKFKLV